MLSSKQKRAVAILRDDFGMSASEIYLDFWDEGVRVDFDDVMGEVTGERPKHVGTAGRVIVCGGFRKTVAEWSEATGFPRNTILKRLEMGWPVHQALTLPPKHGNNAVQRRRMYGEA